MLEPPLQQQPDEKGENIAECGDDAHDDSVENNGFRSQKAAAHQRHDCLPNADAAGSAGGDEADDPREEVSAQEQPQLFRRNVAQQDRRNGIHGGGNQILRHIEQEYQQNLKDGLSAEQFAVLGKIALQRFPKFPVQQQKRQNQHGNPCCEDDQEIPLVHPEELEHVLSHEHQRQQKRRNQTEYNVEQRGAGDIHMADLEICCQLVASHVLKDISGHVFHQIRTGVHRQRIPHGDFGAGEDTDEQQPRQRHEENDTGLDQRADANGADGSAVGKCRPVHVHGDKFFHHKDQRQKRDDRADQLVIFFEKTHRSSLKDDFFLL